MKKSVIFAGLAVGTLTAGTALAQDAAAATETATETAEAKPATFDAVEAKLCSSVHKREAVDTKTNFSTGDKAYFWMKLRPNATKTEAPRMKIRWSLNDKPYWTMDEVPVRWGRSWYYKTVDEPGEWKAELLDENETVVQSLAFTATGESYKRPETEPETSPTP